MKHAASNDRSTRKNKLLIALLSLITLAAVSVTVWALFFRAPAVTLAPDYMPPEAEDNAEDIPGDSGDQAESEVGGGSVSLSYSDQVSIELQNETAFLYFANPGRSNQNMVIQIVVQDQVIVQSGTLKPGKQVMKLDLLAGAAKKLSPGGYHGKFVILYYDPATGEKAMLSTDIPIQITVKN